MAIPSTIRKPGQFHEIDLVSGAVGLTPLANRVLLLGEFLGSGSATADEFVQIFDENQVDLLFGQGSVAALMCRKALETGRRIGVQPEIFCSGVADPGGAAATRTITVTPAAAAAAADIVFRVAGRTLRAGISLGDDEQAVAQAIVDVIKANLANLPVTAARVLGVVTLTAVNTGVNGNDIKVTIEDVGLSGLAIVAANAIVGVGVVDNTVALDNSLSLYFETKAISNHALADIPILQAHLDLAWAPAAKRWNFIQVGETGTLATGNTFATTADDERIQVVTYEDSPSLPSEIAAAQAVAISSQAQPNFNWDGFELPIFIPPDASVYIDSEIEAALAAGATPYAPNDQRTATTIVRLVTTKSTEGGNPFENAKDLSTIRGLVTVIRQLDITFSQQFKAQNKSQQVIKRMRSVAYGVLKLFEAEPNPVVQNVDALFPQLLTLADPNVATRALVTVPESIIPNLHQIVFNHVLFVE